jgi:hypothetical protein
VIWIYAFHFFNFGNKAYPFFLSYERLLESIVFLKDVSQELDLNNIFLRLITFRTYFFILSFIIVTVLAEDMLAW